ncbi:MAG: glycosyltransferase family 39 protein, partial [bacterium]
MNRKNLKLYLWGVAFVAVFALSHAAHLSDVVTVFDGGRGAGFILGAPGQTPAPPSWVFRYGWLLAAALCFAPAAAPLGRAALRFVAYCRREVGDWWVAGILGVAAAVAAACFAHLSLGGEGHTWEEREYEFQARTFAAGTALGRPWLVNPIIAFFTALALYGYGRRVVGVDAALVGVSLYAVSPFAAFNNASLFAEPAFLLFLILFLWAFDAAREPGKSRLMAVAGALLVVAFAVRDYAALAALPAVALLFYDVARKKTSGYALSYFALGVALAAAPLLYYNYATSGAPFAFPRSYALHTRSGISLPYLSPYLIYFTTRRLWVFATDLMGWPLISFVPALV